MSILLRKSQLDYGQYETLPSLYSNAFCSIFARERSGYSPVVDIGVENDVIGGGKSQDNICAARCFVDGTVDCYIAVIAA